tara:strand:- start:48 stop:329 length:282 start_codon:yes stop_codon:yes gene_type:complete
MKEEEYITIAGCGTMEGRDWAMRVKLKDYFVEQGIWESMPDQIKYVLSMVDMMKRQIDHENGTPISYHYFFQEHTQFVEGEQAEYLSSLLPEY